MTFKFVDGQEGTTGLRIHEYLAARSDIEVLKIDADKRKDRPSAPAC
jgi:N-acetyl-gamma-glutamyl-phosphate reductase